MNTKLAKELKRITGEVFENFKDRMFKEVDTFQATKELIRKAEADPDLTDKERESVERLKTLQDAGMLEEKEQVVIPEVAEEYDKALDKALKEAIKTGRIPKPKSDKFISEVNKKIDKCKKKQKKQSLSKSQTKQTTK